MKREATQFLKTWIRKENRKPLIIRGARQVGKSTLVKLFCEEEGLEIVEINLEIENLRSVEKEDFSLGSLLDEIQLKKKIILKEKSLIFFDEIQESPRLLKLLRYFYEKAPQLNVIAAGSSLEIALKSEDFSFPVGRVEFYHLGPMSFPEFLRATKQDLLVAKLSEFDFSEEVHESAIEALRNYFYIGGMPEVVDNFCKTGSLVKMRAIQAQIIQSYLADFPKYNKRIDSTRISRIFASMALAVGKKVIFSKLDTESVSRDIKRVVELLTDAKVILPCTHTDGNSSPLRGESDDRIFKPYFLDIGLLNSMLNLDLEIIEREFKSNFNAKGVLAEQFVAMHLNSFSGSELEPNLFYHLKDRRSQKAEIDFLIETKGVVYPIEVKSSSSGHLKSLKYFCTSKKSKVAYKVSLSPYSEQINFVEGTKLINLPLYALPFLKGKKGGESL